MRNKAAFAVIGANFGDEGKGHIVDWLAARDQEATVVRFNGGAQAGHTVEADGVRHVFHHFGSGTLAHANTFLSQFFVVNPLLWEKEHAELVAIGYAGGAMFVDERAPLTTPYDMLINQELERHRGTSRHGSCGVGINETITRLGAYPLFARDLEHSTYLIRMLENIRDNYVVQRIRSLESSWLPTPEFMELLNSESLANAYLDACQKFIDAGMVLTKKLPRKHGVIFEGAQGLLLDEFHEYFPYVTRSRTGLTNVVQLCREHGIDEVEAIYTTRTYATRHGVGPFPGEDRMMSFVDLTNVPNVWQGSLRFGRWDAEDMQMTIERDLKAAKGNGVTIIESLAMTCLDQHIPARFPDWPPVSIVSDGPNRNNVRWQPS